MWGSLKSLLQGLFLFPVFATYYLMISKQTPNCILTSSQLFVAKPYSSGVFPSSVSGSDDGGTLG